MEVYSLGKTVRILAILDGVILLLNCAYFPVLYMLLLWVSTRKPRAYYYYSILKKEALV